MHINQKFYGAIFSATILPIVLGWMMSVSTQSYSYLSTSNYSPYGKNILLSTSTPTPTVQSLKSLVVTPAEIDEVDYEFSKYYTQRDVTDELKEYCQLDCVKILWEWSSAGVRKTLIMIRTPSHIKAIQAVKNFYEACVEWGDAFYPDTNKTAIPEGWSGFFDYHPQNNLQLIVARTHGPVIIYLIETFNPNVEINIDDPGGIIGGLENIAKLQIEKLREGGYEP